MFPCQWSCHCSNLKINWQACTSPNQKRNILRSSRPWPYPQRILKTSVTFYINGTLVATHTTNIPSTGTPMSIVSLMNKTIGTSVRTMLTDYFMYEEIFTNPR